MKTIQVADDVYEFLKSCQEELLTQDNRATANPIFGFKEEVKSASYDPQEYEFVNEDHTNKITNTEIENWEEDLADYIINKFDDSQELFDILFDESGVLDMEDTISEDYTEEENFELLKRDILYFIKATASKYNINFLDLFLQNFDIATYGYEKQYRMYEESVSFFESDLQAHINMNKHNMKPFYTYVYYNNRTPKMTELRKILMKELLFNE